MIYSVIYPGSSFFHVPDSQFILARSGVNDTVLNNCAKENPRSSVLSHIRPSMSASPLTFYRFDSLPLPTAKQRTVSNLEWYIPCIYSLYSYSPVIYAYAPY